MESGWETIQRSIATTYLVLEANFVAWQPSVWTEQNLSAVASLAPVAAIRSLREFFITISYEITNY